MGKLFSSNKLMRSVLYLTIASVLLCCIPIFVATPLKSQTSQSSSAAERVQIPQWQINAGGKMSFDVASVKQHTDVPGVSFPHENFSLDNSDSYEPTGGLLSGQDLPMRIYISFAYKLTWDQLVQMIPVLPKWASNKYFDIEARGPANATKDQMRLMMQALLEDRFKLAAHWQSQEVPAFLAVLAKPGKTGPQLLPYSDPPCTDLTNPGPRTTSAGITKICGSQGLHRLPNGEHEALGKNQAMQEIAPDLRFWPDTVLDRPVIDGTGLTGRFDYFLIWAPDAQPGQPQVDGPSYLEALRDQLGLKLDPAKTTMPFLRIDHIEEPTAN